MISWQEIIKDNLGKTKPWPIRPGDLVRVYQQYTDKKGKTHTSIFEGIVLKISSGEGLAKTFTLRRVVDKVGVERIYPLFSPSIRKIEILKRQKVRRAKLYYLRKLSPKKSRLIRKEIDKKTIHILALKEKTAEKAPQASKSREKEKLQQKKKSPSPEVKKESKK